MTEQLENILDECIESVLAGRDTIDSCCSRYPQIEADLRPLLDVAQMSRAALKTDMPDAASAATREIIISRAMARRNASMKEHPLRTRLFGRQVFLRPVALGAGLIFLLSAGTALAATSADPDSLIYPLEQSLENARTALTIQKLDKARVEIAHANERLDETERMAAAGKPEYIPDLMSRFDNHMDNATGLLEEAVNEGEDGSEIEQMIRSTRERLGKVVADIKDRIPDELRDSVREAADESDRDTYGPGTGASSGTTENDDSMDMPGSTNGGIETHSGDSGGAVENHDPGTSGGTSEPPHQDPPSSEPPHSETPSSDPPHSETPHEDSHSSEEPEATVLHDSLMRH
ncbi:MAG: DUF5667 domain-containing protein [Thermoleophilia bacterium]